MKTHSATPWEFIAARKVGPMSTRAFIRGHTSDQMPYALEIAGDDYTGYGDDEQREEDLRFIVKACNAHDDLVATLREICGLTGGKVGEVAARALMKAGEA